MSDRRFLTAQWRNLVMANFVVDPAVLKSYVPTGTSLDSSGGTTYVSVVAFQFLRTKVFGIPIPFHRNFEEINLRFYVYREVAGELRKGVVFIRELVPRRAIAFLARVFYQEPYIQLPTRSKIDLPATDLQGRFSYQWKFKGKLCELAADVGSVSRLPEPDSIEEFISERYWGYNKQSDGSTMEYKIKHPKWPIRHSNEVFLDCDVEGLYGTSFGKFLQNAPASVFTADGSDVIVYRGVRFRV